MPLVWSKCPICQTNLRGLRQEKAERADIVTLIKQLKRIIVLTSSHLQGRVLIFKHIEPKNICYVRQAQGKTKTTPSQKNATVGSGIPHSQFCSMAFHPSTKQLPLHPLGLRSPRWALWDTRLQNNKSPLEKTLGLTAVPSVAHTQWQHNGSAVSNTPTDFVGRWEQESALDLQQHTNSVLLQAVWKAERLELLVKPTLLILFSANCSSDTRT